MFKFILKDFPIKFYIETKIKHRNSPILARTTETDEFSLEKN